MNGRYLSLRGGEGKGGEGGEEGGKYERIETRREEGKAEQGRREERKNFKNSCKGKGRQKMYFLSYSQLLRILMVNSKKKIRKKKRIDHFNVII